MKFINLAILVFVSIAQFSDFVEGLGHMKKSQRKLTLENRSLIAKFRRLLKKKTHLKSNSYLESQSKISSDMTNHSSNLANVDLQSEKEIDPATKEKFIMSRTVLVDIQEIELASELVSGQENNVCQSGYELVKDRDETIIRINQKNYIYLCAKYKQYANLDKKETPINELSLQLMTNECGSLKSGELNLNKDSNDVQLYLCRGYKKYNKERNNCPIDKLKIYTRKDLQFDYSFLQDDKSYNCDQINLNYSSRGNKVFLCYHRNCMVPRDIKYENIYIQDNKKSVVNELQDMVIDEFIMDNGDGGSDLKINVSIESKEETSKAVTKKHTLEVKLSGENSNASDVEEIAAKANPSAEEAEVEAITMLTGNTDDSSTESGELNFKFDWTKAINEELANTMTTELSCTAPAGSHYKCQKSEKVTNYDIPYKYDAKYYLYGYTKPLVRTKEDIMKNVPVSEFVVKSCCYRFCSASSVKCDGYVKPTVPETEICNSPKKQTETITQTKTPLDAEFDVNVVVDILLLMGSKGQACPGGYEQHNNNDLKDGSYGNYAYLCKKFQKLSRMEPKYTTINEIRVQYGNSNCGKLRLLTTAANDRGETESDISGTNKNSKIYICFGNNPESQNYLITDFELLIQKYDDKLNQTTGSIIKELMKDNLGIRNGNSKYLLITRDSSLPREVRITDYVITKFSAAEYTFPSQVDEIEVSGASITKSITVSRSNTFTDSNSFEFGVGIKIEGASLLRDPTELPESGDDFEIYKKSSLEVSYTNNSETSVTKTNSKDETQDVTCSALPMKSVRCMISKTNRSMIKEYKYNQQFIGYDGKILKTISIKGKSETKASTSLSVASCCISGCCEGEELDKKAGRSKQCYDSNSKSWRPKDVKCTEYDLCIKNAKEKFDKKKIDIKKNGKSEKTQ